MHSLKKLLNNIVNCNVYFLVANSQTLGANAVKILWEVISFVASIAAMA